MELRFSKIAQLVQWIYLAFFIWITPSHADGAKIVPPPPYYYLLDEPKIIDTTTRQSIEALLVEHDRLTGEQFMIAILEDSETDLPKEWPRQIFRQWGVGNRPNQNGILLTLFWKDHKAHFEVGFGLESSLTPAKQSELISKYIQESLNQNNLKVALTSGVFHTLQTLNSPLIESEKAAELLLRIPGINATGDGEISAPSWKGWVFLFSLGILALALIFHEILAREAYFNQTGWRRVQPLRMQTLKILIASFSRQKKEGGIRGSW